MACVDYKDLAVGRRFRRVIDYEGGSCSLLPDGTVETDAFVYHISLACNHCEQPECMHVCPTGAMHKDDLGLVCVDTQRCIGCGYCTMACPYHAPSIDPAAKQSSKCNGCAERVASGKRPICVEACPLRALDFGEMDELSERHGECGASIKPLPSPDYTHPALMVNLSPAAASLSASGRKGVIGNGDEIGNNGGRL